MQSDGEGCTNSESFAFLHLADGSGRLVSAGQFDLGVADQILFTSRTASKALMCAIVR